MATVRNAGPVTVTPVGLHAIRWMGLWQSSAMVVALELLERKRHWMGTRSTTTMIAICYCFPYCFAGTRHCSGVHAICRSSGCTCGLWKACGCNGLWPLVVESLWLQWPVAAGCGKPVAALGATYQPCAAHAGQGIRCLRRSSRSVAFCLRGVGDPFALTYPRPTQPHSSHVHSCDLSLPTGAPATTGKAQDSAFRKAFIKALWASVRA